MSSNRDIIAAHYEASDRGDVDEMLAPLAPDARWTEMAGFPYAGTYIGPAEVRRNVFERIGADWEAYRADITELIDGGDTVIGLGTYSGTNRASGRFFEARVAHVWRLEGGRVVAFEQFTDTARVRDAL